MPRNGKSWSKRCGQSRKTTSSSGTTSHCPLQVVWAGKAGAPPPSRRARRRTARPRPGAAPAAGHPWPASRRRGPPATRADRARRLRRGLFRRSAARPARRRRRCRRSPPGSLARGRALPPGGIREPRSGARAEGVDDPVLELAQLLGGDEVGRRGEEEAVGALGGRLDPGPHLVELAGGAGGLDHLVADRGGNGGGGPPRGGGGRRGGG